MGIKKHNRATVGTVSGHNTRTHPTSSQLPKAAWFTSKGRHQVKAWSGDVLDKAKELSTRKDAVLAIEIIVQVGNQTDWREIPTPAHPHGKPKAGCLEIVKKLHQVMLKAATEIFGADNIIGIDLHTDESSPHCHIVVAPIHAGKLQAKHWLNGPAMVAQLRERVHRIVNDAVPCTYEKGAKGGAPHDPSRAAGAVPVPSVGLMGKLKAAVSHVAELDDAKKRIKALEEAAQVQFSKLAQWERS